MGRIAEVAAPTNGEHQTVVIKPPRMAVLPLHIIGTAPYLQCRFPEKARNSIMEKQAAGSQGNTKKRRDARNFDADYAESMHKLADGSHGIPAAAFRAAAISACRIVSFKMTLAKLSVFIACVAARSVALRRVEMRCLRSEASWRVAMSRDAVRCVALPASRSRSGAVRRLEMRGGASAASRCVGKPGVAQQRTALDRRS